MGSRLAKVPPRDRTWDEPWGFAYWDSLSMPMSGRIASDLCVATLTNMAGSST